MRLKDNTNPFIHVNPPYQLMVIHSSKLVYPRELYQRGVERKRVELIAAHFNEYVANEPKVSFRNGQFIVTDGQHTIEGRILRNGGKDLPILCKVYTGMTVEQEALLFAEQNGFSAPLTAGIKLRAKAVSYTHLDVYKRQRYGGSWNKNGLGANDRANSFNISSCIPVSYTHLSLQLVLFEIKNYNVFCGGAKWTI